MRSHCILSISALLFLTASLQAQPDQQWLKIYDNESGSDRGQTVVQTADGGFVIAGITAGFGPHLNNAWLLRLDSDGDSLWSRAYGDDRDNECNTMIQVSDGGFVLGGWTETYEDGVQYGDCWLLRLNADGDSLWSRTYRGEEATECISLVETEDRGFALAIGPLNFMAGSNLAAGLLRTNENGDSLWFRSSEERDFFCWSVLQTTDGGYALAGSLMAPEWREYFHLIRMSGQGNVLWNQSYATESGQRCASFIQTTDDGFALVGRTNHTPDGGPFRLWVVKTDESGDEVWSHKFEGVDIFWGSSILQTDDGGFVAAGDATYGQSVYLARLTENGDSLWMGNYGRDTLCMSNSLIKTSDGGFALAGTTINYDVWHQSMDFFLLKTSPDPVSVPGSDFILHPSAFILLEPYPNPFNSSAVASYELRVPSWVNLSIYDGGGRFVRTLVDDWQSFGKYRVVWNAAGYPAGQYWVRLTDNQGGMAAQPVLLLK